MDSYPPPWPGQEGNPELLQEQRLLEYLFFEPGTTIRFDRIPSLQVWAPLVGASEKNHVKRVVRMTVDMSRIAKRALTAEELERTSYFAAEASRWYPLASLATLATASYLTWSGRQNFRFPLYTPEIGKRFHPHAFPSVFWPWIQGRAASRAWHIVRSSVYLSVCFLVFAPLGSSIATMSFEAKVFTDPRLNNLIEDIKKNIIAQRAGRPRYDHTPGVGLPRSSQGLPPYQFPRAQKTPVSDNQADSDHEHGTYGERPENSFSEPTPSPRRETASPTPKPSWPQNDSPSVPPSNPQVPRFPGPGPQSVNDLDPFDDDDGSPVSAARRAEQQRAQSAQGISAWDRVRQQSQSSNSPQQDGGWAQLRQDKTPTPREVQPKTEGFAYTKSDEDKEKKNYEKEQAQKDFDALLESERRGGSNKR